MGIYLYSEPSTQPEKYLTPIMFDKLNSCGYYYFAGLVRNSKYYNDEFSHHYDFDYDFGKCIIFDNTFDDLIDYLRQVDYYLTYNSFNISYFVFDENFVSHNINKLHFLIHGKYKCKIHKINNKSDVHKIKRVEFKRVNNKHYFSKCLC